MKCQAVSYYRSGQAGQMQLNFIRCHYLHQNHTGGQPRLGLAEINGCDATPSLSLDKEISPSLVTGIILTTGGSSG